MNRVAKGRSGVKEDFLEEVLWQGPESQEEFHLQKGSVLWPEDRAQCCVCVRANGPTARLEQAAGQGQTVWQG